MRKLHFTAAALVVLAGTLPALAQTGTTTGCTTAPTSITALNLERTLAFPNGFFSSNVPSLPPAVVVAVASGALEVRDQLTYNPSTKILTVQGFTAQPASPKPTPPNSIGNSSILTLYRVQVENVAFSCQPVASVLMTGRIIDNFPLTPYGDLIGAPIAIGFGYTTSQANSAPQVNNLTILVPGVAGLFSGSASGTLTFPALPVNPPGTTGTTPTIVFSPGATQETAQRQLYLDASKSTDPNGLQLTYQWRQVNSNISAGLSNGSTATPLVTLNGGKGDYIFEVTVTNSKGVSATAQTTIRYYGQ